MIIAEIGLNHMGSEIVAMRMLKKLIEKNIDAITFQIKKPSFYTKNRPYKNPISNNFYKKAIEYVHKNKKLIGFAIADKAMISFLNDNGSNFWKTLSGDASNHFLHAELQKTGKVVYISTGLSDEQEIIEISKRFQKAVFIHTQLTHDFKDANLKAIKRLRDCTGGKIAFGLHCSDISALYFALMFEPSDIFFYVKENPVKEYPDNKHAIYIHQIENILEKIEYFKKGIGNGVKQKIGISI